MTEYWSRLLYSPPESDVAGFLVKLENFWPKLLELRDKPPEENLVSFKETFDHIGALVAPEREHVPDVLEAAGYEVTSFQSEVIAAEIGAPTRCFKGRKVLLGEPLVIELFMPETVLGRRRARSQGRYGSAYGEGVHYAFRIDDRARRVQAIDELEALGYFLRTSGVNRQEQQTIRFFDGPHGRVEIVCAGVDR